MWERPIGRQLRRGRRRERRWDLGDSPFVLAEGSPRGGTTTGSKRWVFSLPSPRQAVSLHPAPAPIVWAASWRSFAALRRWTQLRPRLGLVMPGSLRAFLSSLSSIFSRPSHGLRVRFRGSVVVWRPVAIGLAWEAVSHGLSDRTSASAVDLSTTSDALS